MAPERSPGRHPVTHRPGVGAVRPDRDLARPGVDHPDLRRQEGNPPGGEQFRQPQAHGAAAGPAHHLRELRARAGCAGRPDRSPGCGAARGPAAASAPRRSPPHPRAQDHRIPGTRGFQRVVWVVWLAHRPSPPGSAALHTLRRAGHQVCEADHNAPVRAHRGGGAGVARASAVMSVTDGRPCIDDASGMLATVPLGEPGGRCSGPQAPVPSRAACGRERTGLRGAGPRRRSGEVAARR